MPARNSPASTATTKLDIEINQEKERSQMKMTGQRWMAAGIAAVFVLVGVGLGALLANINARQAEGDQFPALITEIAALEVEPAVWGQNFPRQFDSFMKTQIDGNRTEYGGSDPYSKLDEKPFLKKAWAGYGFAIDYNEDRGHFYAQIDQARTGRTTEIAQPGTCANCHTGNFMPLVAEMGWDNFNATPYDDLREHLGDLGMSCGDCHDPDTMNLRITRPALINALEQDGFDWTQATRQEMRSLVCAQCHVEYYFKGEGKTLTFPWDFGQSIEGIEQHYDTYGFKDWEHELTKAPMIKIQHPETELYSSSIHAANGVACADCHMPYTREGGVKVSDHWIRSPLDNLNNSCQSCHRSSEAELRERVVLIQSRTKELMGSVEAALSDAIDAIVDAMNAGVSDPDLEEARARYRSAQMRWDFVDAENSTGFHNPQEAARILGHAVDLARQAQLSATEAMNR